MQKNPLETLRQKLIINPGLIEREGELVSVLDNATGENYKHFLNSEFLNSRTPSDLHYMEMLSVFLMTHPEKYEAIKSELSEVEQSAIEQKQSKYCANILQTKILEHNSIEFVSKFVDKIKLFKPNVKASILQETNENGYNSLMLAASSDSPIVPALLDVIEQLELKDREKILWKVKRKQGEARGDNFLMLAVKSSGTKDSFIQLLPVLKQLTPQQTKKILFQVDEKGRNILMLATLHKPEVIGGLVSIFTKLGVIGDIFERVDDQKLNVMALAIAQNPIAIPYLLKEINVLPEYTINEISKYHDFTGEQLVEALRLMGPDKTRDTIQFFLKYEDKFSPKHWFEIVKDGLLPLHAIKSQKEKVYEHIQTLVKTDGNIARESVGQALNNKDSNFGTFFRIRRGWRECRENAGTLKKLKELKDNIDSSAATSGTEMRKK